MFVFSAGPQAPDGTSLLFFVARYTRFRLVNYSLIMDQMLTLYCHISTLFKPFTAYFNYKTQEGENNFNYEKMKYRTIIYSFALKLTEQLRH